MTSLTLVVHCSQWRWLWVQQCCASGTSSLMSCCFMRGKSQWWYLVPLMRWRWTQLAMLASSLYRMGYFHTIELRYLLMQCLSCSTAHPSSRLSLSPSFPHSFRSLSIDQAIMSWMNCLRFSQYFSKKLPMKPTLIPSASNNSCSSMKMMLFSTILRCTECTKYSSKMTRQLRPSVSSPLMPLPRHFFSSSLISFIRFLKKGTQKSFSLPMFSSTASLLVMSAVTTPLRAELSSGSRQRAWTSSRSITPKKDPLIPLMYTRSSSKDRTPEKSNLMLSSDSSLSIFDILVELRSPLETLVSLFYSYLHMLRRYLTLTLNFSRAEAKCSTELRLRQTVTFQAINSYFQLNL